MLKNKTRDLAAFDTSRVIACAQDVKQALEETDTNVRIFVHTAADITSMQETIPGQLTSLRGAQSLHYFHVGRDGTAHSKLMPGDSASRRINLQVIARRAAPASPAPVSQDNGNNHE